MSSPAIEHWKLTYYNLWCDHGFREIEAKFGTGISLTPFQIFLLVREPPSLLLWVISKGAKPTLPSLMSTTGDAGEACYWAHFLGSWTRHLRSKTDLREIGTVMPSLVKSCTQSCAASISDNCKCFCSAGGCQPVHHFQSGSRRALDRQLRIWTKSAPHSGSEVQEAYEASCRLEIFR